MAVTTESAATNGRARASATEIVIAGDRTASRLKARRHSRNVQILKFTLPVMAVLTAAAFATFILGGKGLAPEIPDVSVPQIVAENLKMQNPHYEGFNGDGGRYWVRAQSAQQDLKSLTVVRLEGITGELTDAKKQKTNLVATRGIYDSKSGVLELLDSITVTGDGGLSANLTRATVKTKENIITSDQPLTVAMGAGAINANQMTIRQKTKEYTFLDDVRTRLQPKEGTAKTNAASETKSLPFGKPGEPVDITSNRLDIDDEKKTAVFSGGVTATQAGATLQSPEMSVTYEGAAGPQRAAEKNGSNEVEPSKVKLIAAREQVVLQQPSGETATSRTALFDVAARTAVLEGDVVLSQGDSKKAVGDRAEYDEAAQTMVLTGPVVVTQGQNELKGRRLVFNRLTSKLQLSSPQGAGPARISAHFVKSGTKPSLQQPVAEPAGDGIPFGPTFKTDPNAPYDVAADRLDVDDAVKAAVFTGNVVAVQGDFTIRSLELTAFYTGSAGLQASSDASKASAAASLTRLQARKKVSVLSKDGQTATGDWAEVDAKKNLATLGGSVVLTQGNNVVRGTKLVIDMNTGEATIKTEPASGTGGAMISSSDGDGSGQIVKADRPSAVFYPGEMTGKKSKPAEKSIDGWQSRTTP